MDTLREEVDLHQQIKELKAENKALKTQCLRLKMELSKR